MRVQTKLATTFDTMPGRAWERQVTMKLEVVVMSDRQGDAVVGSINAAMDGARKAAVEALRR